MKFARKPNRIYTIMDFEDGEEIEFAYYPSVPSSKAKGYEIWSSKKDGRTMLLTPDDVAYCQAHSTENVGEGEMKIRRLKLSIQTVKENIKILESQEPEDAGYYLQLEYEKIVLEALEKQMPERPIEYGYYDEFAVCPNCGGNVINQRDNDYQVQCCHYCGQKLDWRDLLTEKGGAEE